VLLRFLATYWYHDENARRDGLSRISRVDDLVSVLVPNHRSGSKEAGLRVAMICNALASLLFMLTTPQAPCALSSDGVQRIRRNRDLGHANVGVCRRH